MKNYNEIIAEKLFGWKWIAFIDIPTRDTDGYPKECYVRQFFSKKTLSDETWQGLFLENKARDAKGTEPLSYRYCSSVGPECVPDFLGDVNADRLVLE